MNFSCGVYLNNIAEREEYFMKKILIGMGIILFFLVLPLHCLKVNTYVTSTNKVAYDRTLSSIAQGSIVSQQFVPQFSGIKKLDISFNGVKIQAADPFLIKKSTQAMDTETLIIRGKRILVRPYILPHISKMTEEEKRQRIRRVNADKED